MTALKTAPPLTVIYRGTLQDTATLVGLAHCRANVGVIAFTGELTPDIQKYFEPLNRWLKVRGLPAVSIHPNLSGEQLDRLLSDPIKDWGWRDEECATAIYLSGLPLPPIYKNKTA